MDDLTEIFKYSACEISDALLKLGVPGAGFLPDIAPLQSRKKAVAPATTVLFVRRKPPFVSESDDSLENESSDIPSNLPPGAIYADLIAPGTIAVLSQPSGATTATMGGLMAMRISKIPAVGVLVDGRVRDVKQLRELIGIPIWCKGNSTVATSAECKAHAMNVPIEIGKTLVCQGDIIMLDPDENGAVCIPKDKVKKVLEMVCQMAAADIRKMNDVMTGMKVQDAVNKS